ncbi:YcxB family protein [Chiayiivirga flava]|uniref:YcxB-like C-terminal domain-containing protein n=1 Tax=Chiayiivirga flava TaxID=659595 RepID=A0A7W8G1E0_9GAMM|nr:YcxB family protein [Chiayiivirga flava]MBB5207545.1 hypothetical protein [Chiayiivirga flava]
MELHFDLRDDDVRVAQRAASRTWQRLAGHWSITATGVLHWMCVGAFVVCVLDQVPPDRQWLLLGLGVAMLATFWATLLLQHHRLKTRLRAGAGPFPQAHHVRIDTDGLAMSSVTGSTHVPWSRVIDVQSLPDHVLLQFAQGVCLPIPRHAFPDAGARDAFLAALAAHRQPA